MKPQVVFFFESWQFITEPHFQQPGAYCDAVHLDIDVKYFIGKQDVPNTSNWEHVHAEVNVCRIWIRASPSTVMPDYNLGHEQSQYSCRKAADDYLVLALPLRDLATFCFSSTACVPTP